MLGALKHGVFTSLGAAAGMAHGRVHELRGVRRFVLLQFSSALGSVVHATPLIPALRAAVPDAEITVCANGFAAEIFRGNPGVDKLVLTPNPTREFLSAIEVMRGAIPRGPGVATLTTLSNERSAIGLAAMLAGARNLVGFTLVPELYRAGFTFDPALSQIENNLRIVGALGHTAERFEPQVFPTDEDFAYARRLLGRFADPSRPVAVLVTQTSVTQRKSWRTDRFAMAAQAMRDRHGMNILLVGSRTEGPGIAEVAREIGADTLSVAGETNLLQLAALLKLCRVGLTLDTGTMHIGRAVGLPMVIVAPAWSPPLEWLPLNDPRFVILKNLDMESAPKDYIIDEVSVHEVIRALDHLLATTTVATTTAGGTR